MNTSSSTAAATAVQRTTMPTAAKTQRDLQVREHLGHRTDQAVRQQFVRPHGDPRLPRVHRLADTGEQEHRGQPNRASRPIRSRTNASTVHIHADNGSQR